MSLPYSRKDDDKGVDRTISSGQAGRVAARLASGAVIGHVIAGLLRAVALAAQDTIVAAVVDARTGR